jgi:hypothetical protein
LAVASLKVVEAVPVEESVTGLPIVPPFTLKVTVPVGFVVEVDVTLTAKVTVVPLTTDEPPTGDVMVIVGAGNVPVPPTRMEFDPVTVLSRKFNLAERTPAAVGLNTIPILQLRPAARTAPAVSTQLVVVESIAKSPGAVPARAAFADRVRSLFPVFAIVNTLTALAVPLSWLP